MPPVTPPSSANHKYLQILLNVPEGQKHPPLTTGGFTECQWAGQEQRPYACSGNLACPALQWPATSENALSSCCPFELGPAGTQSKPSCCWPRSTSANQPNIQYRVKSTEISASCETLSFMAACYGVSLWHQLTNTTRKGVSQDSKPRPAWLTNPLSPLGWLLSTELASPLPGCTWCTEEMQRKSALLINRNINKYEFCKSFSVHFQ